MSTRAASRTAAEKLVGYLASECDADCVSHTAPNDVQYYHRLLAIFAYGGRRGFLAKIFFFWGLFRHTARHGGGGFPPNPPRRLPSPPRAEGGARRQGRD